MNTKTKPAWSSFRPDHFESVLSIRSCGLSEFYLDQLHLLVVIENQVCLLLLFNFLSYTHNLPRRSPLSVSPPPNNNKISVHSPILFYVFFSSKTSVLCILLHSPLTLFFSAAPCFYVSQEGLILYSCVLLARSLTCANY